MNAISYYNLGNTLEETKNTIARKFKTHVPITTIQSWIKEYSGICTFARLRKEAIKPYNPNDIIFSQKLQHNQVYNFQLHKAKLKLASKELIPQKFRYNFENIESANKFAQLFMLCKHLKKMFYKKKLLEASSMLEQAFTI